MDLPSLRIEDGVVAGISGDSRSAKKKERAQRGPAAMSHISGVKRPLTHTNSFTGERVPVHGVETPHDEELTKVPAIKPRPSSFIQTPLAPSQTLINFIQTPNDLNQTFVKSDIQQLGALNHMPNPTTLPIHPPILPSK